MRRAINREMIERPESIADNELETLIGQIASEIQTLFPNDDEADALAYGKLMAEFRKGIYPPENISSDQIEDWLLGRVVLMIVQSADKRRQIHEFMESRNASP